MAGWPTRMRLTAGSGSFLLDRPVRVNASGSRRPMEVRRADLPMSVLGDAAFTIEPAEPGGQAQNPQGSAGDPVALWVPPRVTVHDVPKVTAQGAGPGLGALARRCGNSPPSAGPSAAVERI